MKDTIATFPILIVVNPTSGGGKAKSVLLNYVDFLNLHKINYITYFTRKSENAKFVQQLISVHKVKTISVVGGDGTNQILLNALPHLNFEFHFIPAGTGNDLGKMLYKTLDPKAVFNAILPENKKTRNIDVWTCNDNLFLNGFGGGFDGAIAHRMFGKNYQIAGNIKYWFELLRIIVSYPAQFVEINGERKKIFMIAAAGGRVYGGSFKVAPEAVIDDGLMDIITISSIGKFMRLIHLPTVMRGKHLKLNLVGFSKDNKLHLKSDKVLLGHLDGEPISAKEYHIAHRGEITLLV